ncbi:MAG: YdcF family protein [Candidatus Pacebacteria bacterium]|nr:YdcF family protein [Candidatus Paceibacterota bacterium]
MVKKNGKWRTTNFNEGDNFGVSGDRLRVIAAGFLYKEKPERLIIVSGGKGQLKGILPGKMTLASVIKDELAEIGVPAEKIIKEEKSGNTYQQLKVLLRISRKANFGKIMLISNRCHLPRIKAMIKFRKDLNGLKKILGGKLKLVSAESVVVRKEPKLKKIIKSAYASRAMKERMALERKGIRDIKAGTYSFN